MKGNYLWILFYSAGILGNEFFPGTRSARDFRLARFVEMAEGGSEGIGRVKFRENVFSGDV